MNNKVLIICAYFGKLPEYIQVWLNSCNYNKEFNWMVVTDDETKNLIIPSNVTFLKMNLDEIKKLILEKTELHYNNDTPYKLCDFKPIYGKIFEDFLIEYTHWGHCDLDMIYGDLSKYINNDILTKYDRIYNHGHLTIYRNDKEVNDRYKLNNPYFNYKYILENKKHYGFDESRGIPRLYKYYNIKYYEKISDFADINSKFSHFTTLRDYTSKQCFYWENGKIFRAISKNNKIEVKEFMYIHFQKRNMPINFNNYNDKTNIYITNRGFFKKENNCFKFEELNKRNYIEEVKRRFNYNKARICGLINTIFVFNEMPNFLKFNGK